MSTPSHPNVSVKEDLTEPSRLSDLFSVSVTSIITGVFSLTALDEALIIYDTEDELTRILADAYRHALPRATCIEFDPSAKEELLARFASTPRGSLVVMIQSTSFRLDDFRIRLHLFALGLQVIEHVHLERNTLLSYETYARALYYDAVWYRNASAYLSSQLNNSHTLTYRSKDATFVVDGPLEIPSLNIGDYREMVNKGGTFPIGEVFTEARDLTHAQGSFYVDVMAGDDFTVATCAPFRVDVTNGLVTGWCENAPQHFIDVIQKIRADERPFIRELGFGLNRAISREHSLGDITAFERMYGFHFSIGEKHSVYKKEDINRKYSKYHVDVFPVIDAVYCNDVCIYQDGQFVIPVV